MALTRARTFLQLIFFDSHARDMNFSSLRGAFAVLLIAYFSADVAAISGGDLETHRLLRAATKRTDLYRRGVRITKRFESELAYVDSMLKQP